MFPNYVIAGAPKCGTTSIFHWLSKHPEVCASTRKEVQYFMDKNSSVFHKEDNYLDHGISGYEKFFSDYKEGKHKVVIEATPGYIYQQTAVEAFSKELVNTRIIFILREPASRLHSIYRYFSQNRAELDENISFKAFVEKIKSGSKDLEWNEFLRDGILHGAYTQYLEKWTNACGKKRIEVFSYDNFAKNEKEFTSCLADFLGIDSSFYESFDFESQNKTVQIKNRLLHRLAREVSNLIPFGNMRDQLRNIYFKINGKTENGGFDTETRNTLQELRKYYQPFNKELSETYGINVDGWN